MGSVEIEELSTKGWEMFNLEDDIWITLTKNEVFDSIVSAIGLTIALALACDILLLFLAGTRKKISYHSVSRVIWAMNFKFTRRFQNRFYRHAVRKGVVPQTYKGINWRKYSGLTVAVLFFVFELVVILLSMPITRSIKDELSQRGGWKLNENSSVYAAFNSGICSNQDLVFGHMVTDSAFISVCREAFVSELPREAVGLSPHLFVMRSARNAVDIIMIGEKRGYGVVFSTSILVDGLPYEAELKQTPKEVLEIVFSMMKQKGIFLGELDPFLCSQVSFSYMCRVNVNTSHPDLIEYDENAKEYVNNSILVTTSRIITLVVGAIEITEGKVTRKMEPVSGKKKIGEAIYSLVSPLQVIILVASLLVVRILLWIVGLEVPNIMNEAVVGYFSRLSCDELGAGPDQIVDITCSTSANGEGCIQYGTPEGGKVVDSFANNTAVM